ncbi:MAG: 50S ribosomal protein L25 [Acidimicrobiales bacterium]
MAEQSLTATTGRDLGSRSTRRLRRAGQVPGVVYGLGTDPLVIAMNYKELRTVMTTEAGLNVLINLDIDGASELCILKELQRDAIRQEVSHVDFIRIDATVDVAVDVAIHLEGEAKEVANASGMVDQLMFSLPILTKPNNIPTSLTVDISDLEINGAIHVSDIALPDGVVANIDGDESVAIGVITRSTLEAIAAEEAAAAAAEGDLLAAVEESDDEDSDD